MILIKKKDSFMLQLSPNAGKLLTRLIGYYKNNIIFNHITELDVNQQTIFELIQRRFIKNENNTIVLSQNALELIQ